MIIYHFAKTFFLFLETERSFFSCGGLNVNKEFDIVLSNGEEMDKLYKRLEIERQ